MKDRKDDSNRSRQVELDGQERLITLNPAGRRQAASSERLVKQIEEGLDAWREKTKARGSRSGDRVPYRADVAADRRKSWAQRRVQRLVDRVNARRRSGD